MIYDYHCIYVHQYKSRNYWASTLNFDKYIEFGKVPPKLQI